MSERIAWLDFAKGVGIFLVVVGHAVGGIDVAGVPDEAGLLQALDQTIYAFHMPLFFLLSGVTFGMRPPTNIQPALIKKGFGVCFSPWLFGPTPFFFYVVLLETLQTRTALFQISLFFQYRLSCISGFFGRCY